MSLHALVNIQAEQIEIIRSNKLKSEKEKSNHIEFNYVW